MPTLRSVLVRQQTHYLCGSGSSNEPTASHSALKVDWRWGSETRLPFARAATFGRLKITNWTTDAHGPAGRLAACMWAGAAAARAA